VNYKKEILKMISRVPQSVTNGSYNMATHWKNIAEKAGDVARKTRASEAELARAYSELKAYE